MALRKNPSLEEILNTFRAAQQQEKTAQDMPQDMQAMSQNMQAMPQDMQAMPQDMQAMPQVCPQCGNPLDQCVCGDEEMQDMQDMEEPQQDPGTMLSEAVSALEDAGAKSDALANASAEANQEVVETGEALKGIADQFINEHTAALQKEATLFGQIFAASCMNEMNKSAAIQDVSEDAYNYTQNLLEGNNQMSGNDILSKVANEAYNSTIQSISDSDALIKKAAIIVEAYKTSLAKLAGYEDIDELEEEAGQELTPQEVLEIVNEPSDEEVEEDLSNLSDEELAELAAHIESSEETDEEDVDEILDNLSDEELAELSKQVEEEKDDREEEVSPEDIADAANVLSAIRENNDDSDVSLEDVDSIAEAIDEDPEKTASLIINNAYNSTFNSLR